MLPQYLAGRTSFSGPNESFLTQHSHFHGSRYVSSPCSGMITTGRIHVTDTSYRRQAASQGGVLSGTSNWRNRCRRTSRACWFLAWLSSWQPARSLKKKNSSLLSLRPSRWSRATPANTSNHQSGPAAGLWPLPAPIRPRPLIACQNPVMATIVVQKAVDSRAQHRTSAPALTGCYRDAVPGQSNLEGVLC